MSDAPAAPAAVRLRVARVAGAEDLALPAAATAGAAGLDLPAAVVGVLELQPGQRALVPTGLRLAIPPGYEGQLRPRSGLALRHGLVLPNSPGTIDSDYRGELKVIVWNAGSEPFAIRRGDRIAQLVVAPVVRVIFQEVAELDATPRGEGGFGHTGSEGRAGEEAQVGQDTEIPSARGPQP